MAESSKKIRTRREGPVTVVTISRPQVRNALDREASRDLAAAFEEFEGDEDARVAVLYGEGGSFCAGADLKELAEGHIYEPWATSDFGPTRHGSQKPVLAAVEGTACAGGLGLAIWCDLRIIDETAVFGVFSRRWGVPMSDGTTVRLPRLVGVGRALDMLLTGRLVEAREAIEIGLATRRVARGETLEEAIQLATRIASFPQQAMLADRRSALHQFDLGLAAALRAETEGAMVARDADAVSGAKRFSDGAGRHGAHLEESDDRDDS